MASTPFNIILTNDDGFDAPGIQTLYAALVGGGFNVHIVAPHVNRSAHSSLGGTAANPIDITEFSPGNYFVDGRPATATLTGLDDLFAGQQPDLGEESALKGLEKNWSKYTSAERTQCAARMAKHSPSYVEFLICLEMMEDSLDRQDQERAAFKSKRSNNKP